MALANEPRTTSRRLEGGTMGRVFATAGLLLSLTRAGCRTGARERGWRHAVLRRLPRRTHRLPGHVHQGALLSRLREADRLRLPPRGRLRRRDVAPANRPL